MKIELKEGISDEDLKTLYEDPLILRLGDDRHPIKPIDHPLLTYISVFEGRTFHGAYLLIKFSSYECEAHCYLLKSASRHSRQISQSFLRLVFSTPSIIRVTGWIREDLKMVINHCCKYGFKIEGRKCHAIMLDGVPKDLILVGLTRQDWEKVR